MVGSLFSLRTLQAPPVPAMSSGMNHFSPLTLESDSTRAYVFIVVVDVSKADVEVLGWLAGD